MKYENVYFITGTAYAGKSTMVKLLADKYNGILCEENYHNAFLDNLDSSKMYRTDKDGSIMFKIKSNKLQIETCAPQKGVIKMNEIKEYTEKLFEDIKHIDEKRNEYWVARELQ